MRDATKNVATWILVIAGACGIPFAWQLGKTRASAMHIAEHKASATNPLPRLDDFSWFRVAADGSISTEEPSVDISMLAESVRESLGEVKIGYAARVKNAATRAVAFDLVVVGKRKWRGEWQALGEWRQRATLAAGAEDIVAGNIRCAYPRLTALDQLRFYAEPRQPK